MFGKLRKPGLLTDLRPLLSASEGKGLTEQTMKDTFTRVFSELVAPISNSEPVLIVLRTQSCLRATFVTVGRLDYHGTVSQHACANPCAQSVAERLPMYGNIRPERFQRV